MERKVSNPGNKLVWLPLNSGEYLPVPAGSEVTVSDAQIQGNDAVAKLKHRKIVQEIPASAKSAAGSSQRSDKSADPIPSAPSEAVGESDAARANPGRKPGK